MGLENHRTWLTASERRAFSLGRLGHCRVDSHALVRVLGIGLKQVKRYIQNVDFEVELVKRGHTIDESLQDYIQDMCVPFVCMDVRIHRGLERSFATASVSHKQGIHKTTTCAPR